MSRKMKRWHVYGHVTGTKYLGEVLAATAEEAKDIALRKAYVSLCHHCSNQCGDPQIEEATVEPAEERNDD